MVMSLTATVVAADFTVGDFTYTPGTGSLSGNATIIQYTGGATVVIPDEVTDETTGKTYKVTLIKDKNVFGGNTEITSVKLGANLTALTTNAFDGCTSLETVDTSGCTALTAIRNMAFQNCTSLTSFVVPANVVTIYAGCFNGCSNLKDVSFAGNSWICNSSSSTSTVFQNCVALESIELPESVTVLPNSMFNGCSSLTSVKLSSAMTEIGSSAFASCTSLKEIDLTGTKITTIGGYAFSGASSLETIKLPSTVNSILKDAFKGTAIKSVISSDTPVEGGINMPLLSTTISVVFQNCMNLVNVDLYDSNITTIANGAFNGSVAVETFKFPKNLNLAQYASTSTNSNSLLFNGMAALREVMLPDAQEVEIPTSLFRGLSALETVIMPEGAKVTAIGNNAFNGCTKFNPDSFITENLVSVGVSGLRGTAITKFTYTSSLETLGSNSLQDCKNLVSVEAEEGCKVPAVENYTFSGCSSLESISLPESIKELKTLCFNACPALVNLDMGATQLVTTAASGFSYANMLNGSSNLESVLLPATLEEIADNTFTRQTSLTSIELPASLKTIGNSAFYGCSLLETVNFPDNLVTIGNLAFSGCKMTNAIFPIGLESIGDKAFQSVPLEGSLTIPGTVRTIGSSAFSGNKLSTIVIYAPEVENENTRSEVESISIGDQAFYSTVANLESVYTNYTTPPTINANVFYMVGNTPQTGQYKANLYVPTPELYKVATGWENFGETHIATGVGEVMTDAGEAFEVYNLQGVRVTKTTDRKLSDLPQGIYIVNGKKVVKK